MLTQSTPLVSVGTIDPALYEGDRTPAIRAIAARTPCPPVPPAPTAWEIHPGHVPALLGGHVARIPVTPGYGAVRVIFGTDEPAPRYAEHDGHALLFLTRAPLLDQHRTVVALVDRLCAQHRAVAQLVATLPALDPTGTEPCAWGSTWGCVADHDLYGACEGPTRDIPNPGHSGGNLCEAVVRDYGTDPAQNTGTPAPVVSVGFGGVDVELADPVEVAAFADRLDAFTACLRGLGAQLDQAQRA